MREHLADLSETRQQIERAVEYLDRIKLSGVAGVESDDENAIDQARTLIGLARRALVTKSTSEQAK